MRLIEKDSREWEIGCYLSTSHGCQLPDCCSAAFLKIFLQNLEIIFLRFNFSHLVQFSANVKLFTSLLFLWISKLLIWIYLSPGASRKSVTDAQNWFLIKGLFEETCCIVVESIISNFYLTVHKLREYNCISLLEGGGKSFPKRIILT